MKIVQFQALEKDKRLYFLDDQGVLYRADIEDNGPHAVAEVRYHRVMLINDAPRIARFRSM